MGQMVLLAGPGVLISTFCLGALVKVLPSYKHFGLSVNDISLNYSFSSYALVAYFSI